MCVLCNYEDESNAHLLISFPYVYFVWEFTGKKLNDTNISKMKITLEKSTQNLWKGLVVGIFSSFPMLFVYRIWGA